jgi:hypothetical protein
MPDAPTTPRDRSPSPASGPAALPAAQPAPAEAPAKGLWERRAELGRLAIVFVQVALIAFILRELTLETSAFRRIVNLVAVGFVVHHLLPLRLRLAFFAALSIAAAFLTLGGSAHGGMVNLALALPRGGALLAIGAALIAVARLPVGFWLRVGLLVLVGAAAAVFRSGWVNSGHLAIVWPVLAALFMFRLMVFVYDVSTTPQRPSWRQSLAYFFLIPNVCALLFPVIDFRTFCSKYYDEDALILYQRGAKWMVRGIVHLLLYRLVDRVLGLKIAEVASGTDLIRFVISNSFLYLKISGTFHLFIGLLLLFGFNLPEANHRYFLAASFTDYWRRVNTYWRAFIMKVFYYPAYFRLKGLGQIPALVLATIWSFFITWALHLYQAWWISGTAALKAPDILFWSILALLVLGNSLWELRRGRHRKLAASRYTAREAAGVMLRTAATFGLISVLWSLWSSATLGQWLFLWSLADRYTVAWGALALAAIAAATFLFEIRPALRGQGSAAAPAAGSWLRSEGARCSALAVMLFAASLALTREALPSAGFRPYRNALVDPDRITWTNLPRRGGGYYEGLTAIDWPNRQFWETIRREEFPFIPLRRVNDLRWNELTPNVSGRYVGVEFTTNRWGMRDRDYEMRKPAGALRIALLGSSHIEGYGIEAKDMFKPAVENRLNDEHGREGRFEMLNFSIGGVGPLGQHVVLQKTVKLFAPDVVLVVTHLSDSKWMNRDIQGWMQEHLPDPNAYLDEILRKARVTTSVTEKVATERLRPYLPETLRFAYRQLVQDCRAINALPVCVFLPVPQDLPLNRTQAAAQMALAREAGFIVIDLAEIYDGQDPQSLMLTDSVGHSNAKANGLIAAALYDKLLADPRIDLLGRARTRTQENHPAPPPSP